MTERKLSREELIALVRKTFQCRENAYAVGFPRGDGKYSYATARDGEGNDLPLTDDAIWAHLKGEQLIGIYPLKPDNTVHWAALDFDGGDDPVQDATNQAKVFNRAGLRTHIERSRSGRGAHLWVFFDRSIPAFIVRRVLKSMLIDASSYDRMFPNQDKADGGYGNLIALPYHGTSYRENKSGFLDKNGNQLRPQEFFASLSVNRAELIERLFRDLPPEKKVEASNALPVLQPKLPGSLKVCEFCNWVKQARERMPNQNQEPELYSLACQFTKLEGGERIFYEIGKLHPYDDDRLAQKWKQAQSKPAERCSTIRANYGDCGKRCDLEYNIRSPYELARVPFHQLQTGERGAPEAYQDVAIRVLERAERIARHEEEPGIAYGWNILDDLTELRRGDLIVLGARPGIGKTAVGTALTDSLTSRRIPVYKASLEMTREQEVQRLIAKRSGIDATRLSKGLLEPDEWKRLAQVVREDIPFYVDDKARSLEQILDMFGELVHRHGKGVGIVDYIQLIRRERNEGEREAVERSVLGFQAMAKLLDIPIILMSQLNRTAEHDERDGEDPMDAWLKGSGSLEQAADVIHFLRGQRGEGVVDRIWRIHKERHRGVAGTEIEMRFNQSTFHFEPIRIKNKRRFTIEQDADEGFF